MPPEGFDELQYGFRAIDEWIKHPYDCYPYDCNTTRPMRMGEGWIDVPDHIRLLSFEYSVT